MLKSETQLPPIIESDNTTSVEVISLDQKLSTAFCKICYSGGSCEQLIHPCFCKGSVGNIHLTCLERWINECGIDRCELCLFQFTSDQTRRYTVWQSLVIWTRNPVHRSLLISDSIVMVVLTIVMACLITSVVMGMTVFSTSKTDSSMDIFGLCLAVAFITVTIIGYTFTVFMIIRDNIRPWYRWWKNCKDIRLNREELSNPEL